MQLLSASWPAVRAQALAARLYEILDQPLLDYGDGIAEALDLPPDLVFRASLASLLLAGLRSQSDEPSSSCRPG